MTNSRLRDRPCIRGSISRKMRGERVKSKGSLPIPRTEGRDVSFMEGLGVFGQDNIASVRRRSSSHTGARAPEEFFLLCGGAVSECFVRTALDTELAIRIACKNLGLVVAIGNGGTLVVFLDPGGDMLDVERDNLASSGNLVLEGVDGASEQRSEQAAIQTGQFLLEPGTARQAVQDIKAAG